MVNTSPLQNLIGYANNPPQASWPGNKRLAPQSVFNHKKEAELNIYLNESDSRRRTFGTPEND